MPILQSAQADHKNTIIKLLTETVTSLFTKSELLTVTPIVSYLLNVTPIILNVTPIH